MVDSPSKRSVLKIENERMTGGFFEMRFDCGNTELGFSIHIRDHPYITSGKGLGWVGSEK